MNLLIGFATKSGAAKTCAELLAKEFPGCTICNIGKEAPDIDNFDAVIIGSGVRMGSIYAPARNFIKRNITALQSKSTAFYLCNAYPENTQKAIDKNIPEKLKLSAICIESFGGKAPFAADAHNQTWIKNDNFTAFVQTVRSKL